MYQTNKDLREYKAIRRVDGVLFNLTVFREGSTIYIDAYDAETSNAYMLTLAAEDIPSLLVSTRYYYTIVKMPCLFLKFSILGSEWVDSE